MVARFVLCPISKYNDNNNDKNHNYFKDYKSNKFLLGLFVCLAQKDYFKWVGECSFGTATLDSMRLLATDVRGGIVPLSGHRVG